MTIQIFEYEGNQLRKVDVDDEVWWVGKDVCGILEIEKHHQALASLPDDERGTYSIGTPSGDQQMTCINEPGLYRLIFKSRKPEAERFKTWVVKDVLPQIRRTGSYAPERASTPSDVTAVNDLYLALLEDHKALTKEHMTLLKWKADYFEQQAQPKPKRAARRALTDEEQLTIKQLISEGKSDSEIALQTGRANSTVWQIRRLVDAQNNGEAGNVV